MEKDRDGSPPPSPLQWETPFYQAEGCYRCPVPGFLQGRDDIGMQDSWDVHWHFSYRHRGHRVEVAGECFYMCRLCGMQVSTADTPTHENLLTCCQATAVRHQHAVASKSWIALRQTFSEYDELLKAVWQFKQGHLGVYYYVEIRSYGMFGPRAPTFPVLGCRSAEKLASWPLSTTLLEPRRHPQDCGTMAAIRVVGGVQEVYFP